MTVMSPLELRLQLKARGFAPIPCVGKKPTLGEWQTKLDASPEEMARWSGANTGSLTGPTPCVDIDITNPEAADAVETIIKDWFDGRGIVPVQFGSVPKRAILFRTGSPFPKMSMSFTDQRGGRQKVEILGDGQQIVAGVHPDTKIPYTWHGECPWTIDRAELVDTTGEEMRALLEHIAEALEQVFGFQRANGASFTFANDEQAPPVEVESELGSMRFEGGEHGIHATQLRCTASLLRGGVSVLEAVETVIKATRKAVEGDARAAAWDWDAEKIELERMCFDLVKKNPELAGVLPDDLRDDFVAAEDRQPWFVFNRSLGKWHVRAKHAGTSSKSAASGAQGSAFELRPFVPFDLATLPPRAWLYGRHYQRRTVSATVAPGGFGKTTLCMVEAVAMATARTLLGEQPTERLHVWYHNGEDNLEELQRQLGAICLHYGIPQEELAGWFFMTSGNEVPLRVAKGYGDLRVDNLLVRCVSEQIAKHEIDVAILDPLVTLHGVEERDNGKMDTVVRIFAAIADAQTCSIELAHHTRKQLAGSTADYGIDDMRGASSVKDAVRAARMLNQMPEKEADEVGVPEHERSMYFRVDRVKGNNAPPEKAVWRRFVNVELPNCDDVGVVVPWDYPGQGSAPEKSELEREADRVFIVILTRFTLDGRTVSERSGANYAPHIFALEPEAKDATPKPGRSGNSKGRPKGVRNFKTDVQTTLKAPVRVTHGGKPRNVSTQAAMLLRLREKALGGDGRALDRLLGLAQIYNNEEFDRRCHPVRQRCIGPRDFQGAPAQRGSRNARSER